MGKAGLDEGDGLVERDGLRSEQQVDVVGHDDVGVEFITAQGAVVEQVVDEEFGDTGYLEDVAPIVSGRGNEGHAGCGCARSHGAMILEGGGRANPTNGGCGSQAKAAMPAQLFFVSPAPMERGGICVDYNLLRWLLSRDLP